MLVEVLSLFKDHGLFGLVVGALIVFVLLFIVELRRKDKSNTQLFKELLDDNRKERETTNEKFTQSTDRLAEALCELTRNLRDRGD